MGSSQDQLMTSNNDQEELLKAVQFSGASAVHAVFRAAVELDLFEIIMAKAGMDGFLSPSEIASQLPTQNPEAPAMLDRMLRLLASNSILKCTLATDDDQKVDGQCCISTRRLYGLTPMCKYFVRDQDGTSYAPSTLLVQDKVISDSWYGLKDAVLEGGIPFNKTHGMHLFEYMGKDSRFRELFNQALSSTTTSTMKKILRTYNGFEGLKEVVDVGGGSGTTLQTILSKYPNNIIRGINFDLPHIIENAPALPGVEHVGGNMVEAVPKGEAILLKTVLHDWKDDQCLKLLKNCWKALPESGKVIIIEIILPEFHGTDLKCKNAYQFDMGMLAMTPGGRERREKEFEVLARGAGFGGSKLVCHAHLYGILEFYKKM